MFIEKRHTIDIQTYENADFNNLVVRVNENEEKILWFTDWFFYIFGKVVILSSVALILFSYRWWFLPVLVLSILPDLILQIKFGKIKYSIWDAKSEVKRKFNLLTWYFSDLASLTEIKIFKNKDYFKNSISQLLGSFNVELNDNENRRTKYKNLTTLVELSVGAFIVFYLMNDVVDKTLAVGTFIFLLGRMSDSRDSISELFRGFSILSSDNKFVTDVFKFLDTKKVVKNGRKKIGDNTPEIEFSDVSFAYPDTKKNVLNNFNFKIKSGEKIAIVGVNGAGKTTLTKLIMRFYDVKQGSISIDGENIKNIELSDYYNRIGFLSQNYAHYKLPVKEAIALGDTSTPLDLDRVIESAKKAGAHEFISAWEHGYETQLGKEFDNGVEPSVGQWQKLALTRMFYKNPQIWILDEPTASIDSVAEMSIFQELENLPKDKTVILISHRFNTVKNANRIMVIEDGEIKEFDSHYKLMRITDSRYRKLFELQKKSFETN
jgi:ABC-type multidrug transport system fused ATPase/permease subunit